MHFSFLNWDRPALDRATEFLAAGWTSGPLDLRDRLIIVPTRHAGRRLRERLAMEARKRNTGVLIGHVETPSFLFRPPPSPVPLATGTAAEIFWRRTLNSASSELRALLPDLETSPHAASARNAAAGHLTGLRDLLCEEGHSLESFACVCEAKGNEELERWQCMAALEKEYCARVREKGWRDDVTAKLEAARSPQLPDGVQQVTVLFVPDPPPLALVALEHLSKDVPVDVCVHAPADLRDAFDAWGRPRANAWAGRELSIDPRRVEVCDDAPTMAERIRSIVAEAGTTNRGGMVIGVGDRQNVGRIAMTLAREGIQTFDPAGTPASRLPLFRLTDRLLRLKQDGRMESLLDLLRHPHALRRLERDAGMDSALLEVVDEFLTRHIPADFRAAVALAQHYTGGDPDRGPENSRRKKRDALACALGRVHQWMTLLGDGALSESLPDLLKTVFEGFPQEAGMADEARLLTDAIDQFSAVEALCESLTEKMELLRKHLSAETMSARRRGNDLDLLGWLELAWEDAPGLLLTDLNDGVIPQSITSDAFLPDQARAHTGLRDNVHRYARDAYILESIVQPRAGGRGQFRGFMPRRGGRGDPLKPSRLLFHGPPEDLAPRAMYFFSDGPSLNESLERVPGWPWNGPDPKDALGKFKTQTETGERHRLSPSALKDYLQCPFGFYLKQVIGLKDPYEPIHEMNAREFGTWVHEIFANFAHSAMAHSADAGAIEKFLVAEAERLFNARFGAQPSLPVSFQKNIVLNRLAYAAQAQAGWRRAGWKILPDRSEFPFTLPMGPEWIIGGRIDRVDEHERTGEICVMDFKTSAEAEAPAAAHLARRAGPESPADLGGWKDLQLPLYVAACRALFPGKTIRAAYFALPNAVEDTGILEWPELADDLVRRATVCARNIYRRVGAGVFWPSRMKFGDREDEYRVFFGDVENHLNPALLEQLTACAQAHEQALASLADEEKP